MVRKTALALGLLLMPVAAWATPADDYAALVTAAKDGDSGVDYTAMRQTYTQTPDYDPLGKKTDGAAKSMKSYDPNSTWKKSGSIPEQSAAEKKPQ